MPEVLNPALYEKLKRLYGVVRVSNQGEAFQGSLIDSRDQVYLGARSFGEYYQICCPGCRDTRFRMYVHHMTGQRDDAGRRIDYLVVCYNEDCMKQADKREMFFERLNDTGSLEFAVIKKGKIITDAPEVSMPGPCTILSSLKSNHPANVYLRNRGFDPEELSAKFQISYCEESHYFLASNRIIVPVYDRDKLRGWQARYIGELPWKDPLLKRNLPPKYFTCPQSKFRSQCIYNWESMKQWEVGIIEEGPTDVWRYGSMSGCIFGSTVTEHQKRKLLSVFRERTLILLLDPDQYESSATLKVIDYFESRVSQFCAVKLPDGTDPGVLGRDTLREYVREQAAKKGVKVRYRKVKNG